MSVAERSRAQVVTRVFHGVIAGVVIALLAGCTATRITSQVNTEIPRRTFRVIVANGNFQDLEYRRIAEGTMCKELERATDSRCYRWADLFFPGEPHPEKEVRAKLAEKGVDAILVIQPTGRGTTSSYVPQSSWTTYNATVTGDSISGTSTTFTAGGYTVRKPWSTWEISLWSIADERVAWYATGLSRGNSFAEWEDLVRAGARKTVRSLLADRMLRPRQRQHEEEEPGDE